jgi:hypothetical protein
MLCIGSGHHMMGCCCIRSGWLCLLLPFNSGTEECHRACHSIPPPPCWQLLGTVGCGRKRMLLLWHAMEQSRGLERSDLLTLRIATALLEPPDPPGHQVGANVCVC